MSDEEVAPPLRPLRYVSADALDAEDAAYERATAGLDAPQGGEDPEIETAEQASLRAARKREVIIVVLTTLSVAAGTAAGATVSVGRALAVLAVMLAAVVAVLIFA